MEPTQHPAQENTVRSIQVARFPAPSHFSLAPSLLPTSWTLLPTPPHILSLPSLSPPNFLPPTSCYSSSLFLIPPIHSVPTSCTPVPPPAVPRPLPRPFTPPPSPGPGLWRWANMAAAVGRDTLPEHWSYGVCRDGRVFFIKCARGGGTRVGSGAGGWGPGRP